MDAQKSTEKSTEKSTKGTDLNALALEKANATLSHAATGGIGGSSVAILKMLCEKGETLTGMTPREIARQFKLGEGEKARKEARKRTRIACDAAVARGDLCYSPKVGKNAVAYVVVKKALAETLQTETLEQLALGAKDFRFDGSPVPNKGRFIETEPVA